MKEQRDLKIYKLRNHLEQVGHKDLLFAWWGEAKEFRGLKKVEKVKMSKQYIKERYSFPQKSMDVWNELEEDVIMANCACHMKN